MVNTIKVLLFDFSRVILFSKDESYKGKLNELYKQVKGLPDFNFFDYFSLNNELVNYLTTLKKYHLVMFTSEIIQNDPAVKRSLDELFEKIFSAKDIGFDKSDVNSYVYIARDIGYKPEEILFIDDWKDNIVTAKKMGFKTHQFINTNDLISFVKKL